MFTETIHGYPVHPVASMFPMSDDETLKALADDIKKNGLREPIVTVEYDPDIEEILTRHNVPRYSDGAPVDLPAEVSQEIEAGTKTVIIDGRNRLTACVMAGVDPFPDGAGYTPLALEPGDDGFEEYVGSWIISKNLHRRHLSTGQRAAVAAKWVEYFAVEAKKRQVEAGKTFGKGADTKLVATLPQANKWKSREKAAEMFNVSPRSVSNAKKLMDESPDDFKRVEAGEVAPSRALKEIKAKEAPSPTPNEIEALKEESVQRKVAKDISSRGREYMETYYHYLSIELGKV